MKIYTCKDRLEDIMTCIYDAWADALQVYIFINFLLSHIAISIFCTNDVTIQFRNQQVSSVKILHLHEPFSRIPSGLR